MLDDKYISNNLAAFSLFCINFMFLLHLLGNNATISIRIKYKEFLDALAHNVL
jgi:hypothetical protein